ncbi:MAG: prepilin-type N-terminal cleavage/methylation domain-containing protein [Nitrospirae bacterium]|nr:prepilin-type N-terminal cleavage/methylation domain-containing protein [Nitrospirota bacterium]
MRLLGLAGQRGFTLIEVIITIVVVALVGTLMFTVVSSQYTNAANINSQTSNVLKLTTIMENITADYRKNYKYSGDWSSFSTNIGAEGSPAVTTTAYGACIVKENHFIKYVSNVETLDSSQTISSVTVGATLKVTIADTDGNNFTTLFSRYQ